MYHILTINQIGRPRPALGGFQWDLELKRYVWKRKQIRNTRDMAQAVNEGIQFMKNYDEPLLELSLMEVDEPKAENTRRTRKLPVLEKIETV